MRAAAHSRACTEKSAADVVKRIAFVNAKIGAEKKRNLEMNARN